MAQTDQLVCSRDSVLNRVSFVRWVAPICIGWAVVCLLAAGAYNFKSPTPGSLAYLFSIYAALYISRVNAILLNRPLNEKILSGGLILFMSFPVAYASSHPIYVTTKIRALEISENITEIVFPMGYMAESASLVLIVLFFSTLLSILICIFERLVVGSTAGWHHFIGFAASGFVSLSLSVESLSLVFLFLLPIPHLFAVWRSWPWGKDTRHSSFTARRALACTVSFVALIYTIGVVRHAPEHGSRGLFWPLLMRDYEVQRDFDRAREMTLSFPLGQGALPIGDRSYMIPAEFISLRPASWNDIGGYRRIELRVPYARWVEGYNPSEFEPFGDHERLEFAEIEMSTGRRSRESSVAVLCAPDRVFGLRQCFAERYESTWLTDMGIEPNDLEPVHLIGQHLEPDRRQVLALDDQQIADAAQQDVMRPVDNGVFIARCDSWRPEDDDPGPPPAETRWRGSCEAVLNIDRGIVRVDIDARLLPFWRQVHAGLTGDLAAWNAAGQNAERIDVVAERVAAEWARHVEIHISPLCQPDRILAAALGAEWWVSAAFPPISPFCRHVRQAFIPGWRPRQDSNLRPQD